MTDIEKTLDDLKLLNRLCHGTVLEDAIDLLKSDRTLIENQARIINELSKREAVKPIKTCKSNNVLGVNGILIVGTCPACGQSWLNNRDNKFCGGCGKPILWEGR